MPFQQSSVFILRPLPSFNGYFDHKSLCVVQSRFRIMTINHNVDVNIKNLALNQRIVNKRKVIDIGQFIDHSLREVLELFHTMSVSLLPFMFIPTCSKLSNVL